jgi:hypothetical protein
MTEPMEMRSVKTGRGVRQGSHFSHFLYNLYSKYVNKEALEGLQTLKQDK